MRWFYWVLGLVSIWVYQQGDLNAGAVRGLVLYLALNVILIPVLPRVNAQLRRYLAVGLYITDLLFASLLIYHTGGLVSQMFLLYCLLVFKAAIYYPYVHPIISVPFLIFPLYVATLFLSTGTIVFLQDRMFISRYILLLVVILAGLYTAWHLDSRHRQTRILLGQLETEHRQVDERRRELLTVLDSIGDGVIVVNPELQLLMINPVAADIYNLTYPQSPGAYLHELIDDPILINFLRQALEEVADKEALICDEIVAHPLSTGKPIVCEALATALVSEKAALHGAVVVLRDVSHVKELEESKTNFISVLSHELRTPLTAIRGFVDLILAGNAGETTARQREYLKIVYDQSEHLRNLISALLEFAEMEASQTNLDLGTFSLEELLRKVLSHVEPLADQRGIALQADFPPDLPALYADSTRVERVLLNLLDNAIKFTPENGSILVTVVDREAELLFCISDTGPGVPPAERERIFERFYQIDDSSTREHGGTGLGLALCKHIVEMHQGSIWVKQPDEEPTDGRGPGSQFCFTIPRDLERQLAAAERVLDTPVDGEADHDE